MKLGFHAITLSDALHPSPGMTDRYYVGPALFLDDEFLGPFDIGMSIDCTPMGWSIISQHIARVQTLRLITIGKASCFFNGDDLTPFG